MIPELPYKVYRSASALSDMRLKVVEQERLIQTLYATAAERLAVIERLEQDVRKLQEERWPDYVKRRIAQAREGM